MIEETGIVRRDAEERAELARLARAAWDDVDDPSDRPAHVDPSNDGEIIAWAYERGVFRS